MTQNSGYQYNQEINLWTRKEDRSISYSDGTKVENRIHNIVKNAEDRSVFSNELQEKISDWPSQYHFTSVRHSLLRPLGIKPGDSVLELGCGCGAMTRYLGEIGADVTSVEGGKTRALVAGQRCKDLDNVKIYLDNLLHFETEKKYDWVLFIGVLEYAPVFSNEDDPIKHYLDKAIEKLKDDGKIVVAIENKIGLKYFNGLSEDHVGKPYYSVNNLYDGTTPETFGQKELKEVASNAGLDNSEFFFPYPDYKLPKLVVHESAFKHDKFKVSELLLRNSAIDYSGNTEENFSEALAAKQLENNGILDDFSNSFLAVFSRKEINKSDKPLAWYFSFGNRKNKFCTQTIFKNNGGEVEVNKSHIFQDMNKEMNFLDHKITHICDKETYDQGESLFWSLLKMRYSLKSKTDIAPAFFEWFGYVKNFAQNDAKNINELLIPGHLIDATPFNVMKKGSEYSVIDTEWKTEGTISLGFLLFRSVYWCLKEIAPKGYFYFFSSISVSSVMNVICNKYGLTFNESDISKWIKIEKEFQEEVCRQNNVNISKSVRFSNSSTTSFWSYGKGVIPSQRILKYFVINLRYTLKLQTLFKKFKSLVKHVIYS